MSNFLDWRDYTRQPHIKKLIETKGVEAARIQFVKESNKALWDDPFIINESYESAGTSVASNNSAAVGTNPQLISVTAETQSYAWVSGLTNNITGSGHNAIHEYYFDVTAYNGGIDYTYNHTDTFKKFRFLIVSGAAGYTYSNTAGLAGLVTASYTRSETANITGSLLNRFKDAVNNQAAGAVVAGFTNTIAPADLFTVALTAGSGSLTIVHDNEGGVPDPYTNFTSATASITVTTNGTDKIYDETGVYYNTFLVDGAVYPYTSLTRKG